MPKQTTVRDTTTGNPNRPSALAAIPPPTNASRTKIVNERLQTASDVVAAFGVMYTADLERSRQRALCQSAVDGAQPYSDNRSRALGTWGRSNFNPGLAAKSTFKECAPYNELLEQMDNFITTPTKFGTEDEQDLWGPIIAEEFTAMLRRWPRFNYQWQYNVSLFVRDGMSFMCWEDESDWRPSVFGMQHFKVPNESKPCEDELDMCGWRGNYNCRDLYKKIQNKAVARKVGWNVEAVEKRIKQAAAINTDGNDYQRLEARWKNNDVLDGARAPQVRVIHMLVKEVDGSVTHLAAPEDGEGPCLFIKKNAFRSMSRFMTMFPYGIGTNGDLHSIRGHTSRIFNTVVAATRTLNAFQDAAMFTATPHLECANDDAMQSIPFRKAGYMTLVAQGNKFLETKVPDFQESLIPLYGLMTQLFEGESSGASSMPNQRGMQRMTNQQDLAERLSEGQLTTSAMMLFFPAMERFLKEVMRRVSRKGYRADEPGGEEVWWLINKLKSRGVPRDALYAVDIDGMEVNTGIGKGSQGAMMATADSLMEDYDLLDEKGKNSLLRMRFQVRAGSRVANKLVPPEPGMRPGQQVENAIQQNGMLSGGNLAQIASVRILPDQNDAAHVQTHLEFLRELWPMTQQQDQRGALTAIQPVWEHCIEDWQRLAPRDNSKRAHPLYKQAKQALREMSEWIGNTAKELAAEEDRQRDTAARAGGQEAGAAAGAAAGAGAGGKDVGGEGPNTSNLIRAVDAQAKLSFTMQKNQEDLRHQREMNALKAAGQIQTMNLRNVEAKQRMLA